MRWDVARRLGQHEVAAKASATDDRGWSDSRGRLCYKQRCVNAHSQFHGIATRYDKTARAFLSMLRIGAAKLQIKAVNTA
jgi:hypothetical protein